jgi:hypothetical protein
MLIPASTASSPSEINCRIAAFLLPARIGCPTIAFGPHRTAGEQIHALQNLHRNHWNGIECLQIAVPMIPAVREEVNTGKPLIGMGKCRTAYQVGKSPVAQTSVFESLP